MEEYSRDLVWRRHPESGTEHVMLHDAEGLRARGTMAVGGSRPYTLRYSVVTDPAWATDTLEVETEGAGWRRRVRLERDPDGWRVTTNQRGRLDGTLPGIELPETLHDAIDVDLGYSPLFNTLPIRRRGLLRQPAGSSETYQMVFVSVPGLVVAPSEQTYTVLDGGRVNYRSGQFSADLSLDADGYVTHYPGLAERA